jgi:hypothetical protein
MGVPGSTTPPSGTTIRRRTPGSRASTSAVVFSDSTTQSTSSVATDAPSATDHSRTVPSSIDIPIWGIRMRYPMPPHHTPLC